MPLITRTQLATSLAQAGRLDGLDAQADRIRAELAEEDNSRVRSRIAPQLAGLLIALDRCEEARDLRSDPALLDGLSVADAQVLKSAVLDAMIYAEVNRLAR